MKIPATIAVFAALGLVTVACRGGEIHEAVRANDTGLLRDLVVNGSPAQLNSTVRLGVTPLHLAAVLDHEEAARLLLLHGAGVDPRTHGGFTPLHWAGSRDAIHVARLLLDKGADIEAANGQGITPLHWAANRNATNVVRLLIAAGADIQAVTAKGATPLHWALMHSDDDAARVIAHELVSREMASIKTNLTAITPAALPPAETRESPPDDETEQELPDVYVARTSTDSSRVLVVNIGRGQELEFEWVEALGIWVGKYEITNGQFRRFKPRHSSLFRESFSLDGDLQPVVRVSWEDANAFCEWLNRTYKDRLPRQTEFRLPSAVEWMAIARCGTSRRYPWGNHWPPHYGNFADLTARENLAEWTGIRKYDDGHIVTCPVKESGENEWRILGLAGNVAEWCLEWYDEERRFKVRMGGSWDFDTEPNLQIKTVGFDRPDAAYDTIGFRVIASMPRLRARPVVSARLLE